VFIRDQCLVHYLFVIALEASEMQRLHLFPSSSASTDLWCYINVLLLLLLSLSFTVQESSPSPACFQFKSSFGLNTNKYAISHSAIIGPAYNRPTIRHLSHMITLKLRDLAKSFYADRQLVNKLFNRLKVP